MLSWWQALCIWKNVARVWKRKRFPFGYATFCFAWHNKLKAAKFLMLKMRTSLPNQQKNPETSNAQCHCTIRNQWNYLSHTYHAKGPDITDYLKSK